MSPKGQRFQQVYQVGLEFAGNRHKQWPKSKTVVGIVKQPNTEVKYCLVN